MRRVKTPVKSSTVVKPKPVVSNNKTLENKTQELTQPPAVEAPVVQPVTVQPEATVQPVSEDTSAKPRVPSNRGLGLCISPARVRCHLDRKGLNEVVGKQIALYKPTLTKYRAAKQSLETGKTHRLVEKEVNGKVRLVEMVVDMNDSERQAAQKTVAELENQAVELEKQVNALSRERIRFSTEASIVLAIICDEFIQQLAAHTMDRAIASKKKIIQIHHLHEPGVEQLSLYPLVKCLPSFVETSTELAKMAREKEVADLLASALAQAEKDFKKKYSVREPKKKKEPVAAVDPVVEVPSDEEEVVPDSKTSFRFYVHQVCKEVVKKDERYKSIRVSTEIRSYLSDLVVEFIQRLARLVSLTANSMKNKTVNDVAILRTVESLLIDGHRAEETVELRQEKVVDPVALKAELAKQEEAKQRGEKYKINMESIPKVDGYVSVRTVKYPTSGFASLAEKVHQKLALYESLSQKEKESLVEESA